MSNMTLDTCALFVQLPSGNWAGDSFSGWKVSIQSFEQGQYPDRFKHEPARKATEDEIVLVKSLICKIAAAKTSASEDAERRLLERMFRDRFASTFLKQGDYVQGIFDQYEEE